MISVQNIEEARQRIGRELRTTPLVPGPYTGKASSTAALKLENMQLTGSFKERGALNKLLLLKSGGGLRGIVASSAGNHAQAVSYHAARLGVHAVIFMPEDTALNKVLSTRRWGAEVMLEGRSFDEATAAAQDLAKLKNQAFIHAFDDPEIVAGQGTLGLELLEQFPDIDCVVIPVGGGGLAGGTAVALKERRPACRVVGVQAENYDFTFRAWKGSAAAKKSAAVPTIADGISMKKIGEVTLPILKKYLDDFVTVTEEEMANAILELLESSKILAEAAGAAAWAAITARKIGSIKGQTVAVVSGGNIDVNLIDRIIEKGLLKSGRLLRIDVVIPDRPGGLRTLAGILADLRANILQIHHDRASKEIALYTTGTELTLETRGKEHIDEILHTLKERGYDVQVRG
ncbi:MAG TPA: threonine ammonia-lyase [Bdellovibrionota bacterium]|nr:threonine ammonia-lyase [Bdellovibrionota bacterium]